MSWDFKPGMLVVCVEDDFSQVQKTAKAFGIILPKSGVVYTIRDVFVVDDYPDPDSRLRLLLNEIHNPELPFMTGPMEADFAAKRFRPVDETRLDVFRNLLVDLPKEEELA